MGERSGTTTEWSATVSAAMLLAVAPHRAPRDTIIAPAYAILIEPRPERGVLLIATDGTTMGIAWDTEGQATGPASVTITEALVRACTPMKMPRLISDWGDRPPPPPAWLAPGRVLFDCGGCVVTTGEGPPDIDRSERSDAWLLYSSNEDGGGSTYRAHPGDLPRWRGAIPTGGAAPSERLIVNPALIARFQAVADLGEGGLDLRFAKLSPEPVARDARNYDTPIVIVRPRGGSVAFFGMIMQMRPDGFEYPAALPDWLGVKEAATAGREVAP